MTELQKPIPTIFLSDDDVCALSDWKSAITALENAYSLTIDHHMTPPRAVARGPGVWLRSMTAISPSGKYMGNKLIAASPKNKCVSYLISLFDTSTTHLAATIDGNHVTAFRTAATSALAVKFLTPNKALKIALIGSGFEAHGQLEAVLQIRQAELCKVFSPTEINRNKFVDGFKKNYPHLNISAVSSAKEAVIGSDLVICAARSHDESPVIKGDWLRPGMMIVSIGSTLPEQREVDSMVIDKSDLIVADMPDEITLDTGDMIVASKEGVQFADKLISLSDVVSKKYKVDHFDQKILLFKSVGSALQDIVVAEMLYEKATQNLIGLAMPDSIQPVLKWNK
ncbi:MAG: ornithine cyclodeaminase family protein [Betaproteobacteria bacterium]|jgi:ornithine cyclodeaminase/alanine dehydrogenase-like protein (mu-crystallin family)